MARCVGHAPTSVADQTPQRAPAAANLPAGLHPSIETIIAAAKAQPDGIEGQMVEHVHEHFSRFNRLATGN
ncbi:hypothetical protein QU481_11310 [Crenobacter sp. SG2303]|uniref:Uncharacterized protein n=1 Tax=Crenobacter oryzisoli TaxID=3056844 RepID=A0ABT7XNW1_9NEIS|nr:hypothetical protein [Crenobacter sp. SG2303]MDN0075480.1 hypothetical protein [Crenobacter sp. SG2303]